MVKIMHKILPSVSNMADQGRTILQNYCMHNLSTEDSQFIILQLHIAIYKTGTLQTQKPNSMHQKTALEPLVFFKTRYIKISKTKNNNFENKHLGLQCLWLKVHAIAQSFHAYKGTHYAFWFEWQSNYCFDGSVGYGHTTCFSCLISVASDILF